MVLPEVPMMVITKMASGKSTSNKTQMPYGKRLLIEMRKMNASRNATRNDTHSEIPLSVVAVQGKGEKHKGNDDLKPEASVLEDEQNHCRLEDGLIGSREKISL